MTGDAEQLLAGGCIPDFAGPAACAAPSRRSSHPGGAAGVLGRTLRPVLALPVVAPFGRWHGSRQPRAVRAVPAAKQGQYAPGRIPRGRRAAAHGLDHRHPERRAVVGVHLLRSRYAARQLCTFNIVWQIDQCRQLGLSHLYLGYWIAQSPKMAYKAGYRPLEYLRQGRWETEPPPDASPTDISG